MKDRIEADEGGLETRNCRQAAPPEEKCCQKSEAQGLTLNAASVLRVDFKLQIGEHSEVVDVNDVAGVNVENASPAMMQSRT
jgi:hypothetical protein